MTEEELKNHQTEIAFARDINAQMQAGQISDEIFRGVIARLLMLHMTRTQVSAFTVELNFPQQHVTGKVSVDIDVVELK